MTTTCVLPPDVEGRALLALRRELFGLLAAHPDLDVDCSRVRALSPAGQAVLLAVSRTARWRGGQLHLDRPSPAMAAALRPTGLDHLLAPCLAARAA